MLGAIIMYVPMDMYPILVAADLDNSTYSDSLDGVISLFAMVSFLVAAVIFVASICIPIIKIVCIFVLMYVSAHGTRRSPSTYNRLYRVVLFIGRWSMIDVFVVIIMSTIVRMSGLLTISPGMAIICFSMVVLITMLAAEEFDERLLWDATLRVRHGTVDRYNEKVTHHAVTNQEELEAAAAKAASAATAANTATAAKDAASTTSAPAPTNDAAVQEAETAYKVLRTYDLLQRVQKPAVQSMSAETTASEEVSAESAKDNNSSSSHNLSAVAAVKSSD